MYLGIDCGTQGTKIVVCDTQKKTVIATGYCKHELLSSENGKREQHVEWWIDALKSALKEVNRNPEVDLSRVKALGVSGQQHGMVLLDEQDRPLHPAKLWCDTETSQENADIMTVLGGSQGSLDKLGLEIQTGYTASKILWFYRNHPETYAKISKVMLPHDYLNYWMTGEFVTEFGDASGTGYMNVRDRSYDPEVFKLVAPGLDGKLCLPKLIDASKPQGFLTEAAANALGLPAGLLVSSGGGDNMMGAIGTGNIAPGIVTMSLGTSGTLYAFSDKYPKSNSMIASFCSSSDGWLPLICTMNVTSTTTLLQNLFDQDIAAFTEMLESTQPGADGITMLPFFNGERLPPLPDAKASIHGLTPENMSQANLLRASTEAATFTIRYGLDLFRAQGIEPSEIRLIGGGAKNSVWRQMVADIMNVTVICPQEHEAAALGSAIQAIWSHRQYKGEPVELKVLCEQWVTLDDSTRALPKAQNVTQYESAYQQYKQYLQQQYNY
jgi:xylulokinase